MVMETNKEEMDKHLKEVAERYPEIRHVYRGLRNKYLYEDDKYIIRPARSAEEIVMEGSIIAWEETHIWPSTTLERRTY